MSNSLPPNGLYRLRYLPNSDNSIVGGLVATEIQGRDRPINAAPDEPGLQGKQTWEVRRVGNDEVEILYVPQEPGDGIGQIGFHHDEDRPGVPIVLSFASKYRTEHIEDNVWRVRPGGNWVGVDAIVGLNEERHDETLSINAYPLGAPDRPAWRFERAGH